MEVTYQLEPEDISQLFRYIRGHRSKIRPVFLYVFLGLVSVMFLLSAVLIVLDPRRNANSTSLPIFVGGFFYIFFVLYSWVLKPRLAARKASIDPQALSRKTMVISAVGVFVRHSLGEMTLHWPLIVDIVDNQNCFYFFMEKNNALAVPKRAFASPDIASEFFATAKQDWITAKNLASPNQEADPAAWPPPPQVQKPQESPNL